MLAEENLSLCPPPKVLVIDDSLDAVKLIATILKHHKCETDIAFDGQDALPLFAVHDYDLVVLDWSMPCMSAPEMLCEVDRLIHAKRKAQGRKRIPLLVYSGHDEGDLDLPQVQSFEYLGVLNKRSHFKTTLKSFDFVLGRIKK